MRDIRPSIFAVALSSAAWAETITVCPSGCDYTSINAAIAAASEGDIIQLNSGVYSEGSVIDTAGKGIRIRGVADADGNPLTVIDGQESHRLAQCVNFEPRYTTFENLWFRRGSNQDGAGLYCAFNAEPRILNCRFSFNVAANAGGAIHVSGGATIDIRDCNFEMNDSDNSQGDDLYITETSSARVADSSFHGGPSNNAIRFRGRTLALERVQFFGSAGTGIVIWADGVEDSVFTAESCTWSHYSGNTSIVDIDAGSSHFIDCVFEHNTGRCIETRTIAGPAILASCIFRMNDNGASSGSAVNPMAIHNCRFEEHAGTALIISPISSVIQSNSVFCSNSTDIADPGRGWIDQGGNSFLRECEQCIDTDLDGVCDDEDLCPLDPLKTAPGRCGCGVVDTTVRGDFNCDGVYDELDYLAMQADLGICAADLNGDGVVSGADLGLLFVAWGTCP